MKINVKYVFAFGLFVMWLVTLALATIWFGWKMGLIVFMAILLSIADQELKKLE